jgi:hypothetical protein
VPYNPNQTTLVGSLSGTTLAASGTQSFTLDLTGVTFGVVQIIAAFASPSAVAGVQIGVECAANSVADTEQSIVGVIAAATGTKRFSRRLPAGKYTIVLTNLDASVAVTLTQPVLDTGPAL